MSHTIVVSRVVVRRPSGVAGGAELRWALSWSKNIPRVVILTLVPNLGKTPVRPVVQQS